MLSLQAAIARYGADAKTKLANPAITGEPEDQLRAPLEALFADLAELCGFARGQLVAVGESSIASLRRGRITRSPCVMCWSVSWK